MIIVITISTFFCIALGVMCVYWLMSREASVVNARLAAMDPTVGILGHDSIGSLVERVAAPISRLVPASAPEVNKLHKQLMQAGYRSPDAPMIFRAIQIVGFVALPSVVVMMCFFLQRPLSSFLIWSFLAAASGFYLPRYVLHRQMKNRQQRITWGLADALDLLVVTVEAGLGLNAALVRVGEELKNVHPDIHEEFEMVNLEIRVGRSREESLRNLAERMGVDDLRSFVAIMIQADRFGSSIGRAVRVFADSLRTKRRQRAQQASQKAALKLLFPLTIFLFPTIIMVILGPAFLNLIDAFSN
ncbi:MAG: type II secretion system F family protein [Acidobacteriota bacterium]|nr:type II secretion system F family protein [Acidobacteriota bacterium]